MNTIPDFKDIASKLDKIKGPDHGTIPSRNEIISILKDMQSLMFPAYYIRCEQQGKSKVQILSELYVRLSCQIRLALELEGREDELDCDALSGELVESLPRIAEMLLKDVQAIYEGDPAARSYEEVILSYPGFYAITVYRIAHEFYKRKIPLISRLMTEYAHEKTGIDIHAGATIGEYFFIDHGTGIVVGETTTIGNRVKLYQGVTLGARSFETDSDGNPVKGIKRHPDIGNNVIIYANATILGGNTKIGDGAVIGGNVWLTRSVEPGATVYYNIK